MTVDGLIKELEKHSKYNEVRVYVVFKDQDYEIEKIEFSDQMNPPGPYIVIGVEE